MSDKEVFGIKFDETGKPINTPKNMELTDKIQYLFSLLMKQFEGDFDKREKLFETMGKLEIEKPDLYNVIKNFDLEEIDIFLDKVQNKVTENNLVTNLKGHIEAFKSKILEYKEEIKLLDNNLNNSLFPDYDKKQNSDRIKALKQKISDIIKKRIPEYKNALNLLTKNKPYHIQPTSATTNFINKVMNTPPDRADTMKSTNKNKIQTSFENNILTIESKSNSSNITISIENFIELFKGNDAITSKIFNFILRKSNDQNHDTNITFTLSDLVDSGLYSNTETARDGIKKALSKLTNIKITGTHIKGNKEVDSGLYVLFTALEIKNSVCTVTRNEKININSVCKYLTLLPIWADTLSKNGYALINYIFYRARQNTADIAINSKFNMKFETIRTALGLPHPEETERHKQFIIEPILKAIKEIETTRDESGHIGFKLTKNYEETKRNPAITFLDGYLEVEILDKAKDYFIEREIEKVEKKKEVKKKRENLATKK